MVGILVDKIDDMEDTWEDVLEIVRQHSIDTRKDTLLKEWAGLVESTRKIVDRVLRISDRFHVASPDAHWEELLQSVSNFIFRLIICKHCGRTPRGVRGVKRSQIL
jgi:hypothetical protein